MRYRRLPLTLACFALALALEVAPASTAEPSYRCENCDGRVGPFNMEEPSDVIVKTAGGERRRLLNALGMVLVVNDRGGGPVFNFDERYIFLVADAQGQKAWVLNVKQRHPEPQASRLFRRYY
jgi:hypothetical protein